MRFNPILNTDSYKLSHPWQFPPGTESLFYYGSARKGALYPRTVFFGLQPILQEYLTDVPTLADVNHAAHFAKSHGLPFEADGWRYIVNLGYYPLRVRAVQEGVQVPAGEILYSIESTDEKVFWLPGWAETQIMRSWYTSTVATVSFEAKKIIYDFLVKSSDNPEALIGSRLQDFGARGVSSTESAILGGMSHLVNFQGSDTMIGILGAQEYYSAADMPGYSIPAMEHSTVTAWGKDREAEAYSNMLDQFVDFPFISVVSDSYDVYRATNQIWGLQLRDKVREGTTVVVIRPDSGNPCEVVPHLAKSLAGNFGVTLNEKGYRVLKNVAIIQGDGMTVDSTAELLNILVNRDGFSAENFVFGMGGGLLQRLDRDTQKFACKLSVVKINGVWMGVNKAPIGDLGKSSRPGRLDLIKTRHGELQTKNIPFDSEADPNSVMRTVFEDGDIKIHQSFAQVRYNADKIFREMRDVATVEMA